MKSDKVFPAEETWQRDVEATVEVVERAAHGCASSEVPLESNTKSAEA